MVENFFSDDRVFRRQLLGRDFSLLVTYEASFCYVIIHNLVYMNLHIVCK